MRLITQDVGPTHKQRTLLLWVLFLLVGCVPIATGCEFKWLLTHTEFEGVDKLGRVDYSLVLGILDLGRGLRIQMVARYNPGRHLSSPYVGKDWTLPLFESRITQLDSNVFRVEQPNGGVRMFWRDNADSNLITGQGGWKGQISGNQLTLWAECGWSFTYRNQSLISFRTPDNNLITLTRDEEGLVKGVSSERGEQLRVLRSATETTIKHFDGEEIRCYFAQPAEDDRRDKWNSRQLVGVSEADHDILKIDYGAPNQIIRRTVIGGIDGHNRELVIRWNDNSGDVVTIDRWNYIVQHPRGAEAPAEISRSAADGSNEYVFDDAKAGILTVRRDGVETITKRYTIGPNAGRAYDMRRAVNGVQELLYEEKRDDKGRLIDVFTNRGGESKLEYDEYGRIKRREWVPPSHDLTAGTRSVYTYLPDGRVEIAISTSTSTVIRSYSSTGALLGSRFATTQDGAINDYDGVTESR